MERSDDMKKNLTEGHVLKVLVMFAIPYLMSSFLQTFYGMADLYIVGQFNNADAISAVSIGSQFMHMLTVVIIGLAMGTTVRIGNAVGRNDKKDISSIVGNTTILFLGISVVLTILLLSCTSFITDIMSTPLEAVSYTKSYLTICFIGIPFIVSYNVISSIFRGAGDSKSPMYFVLIACITNIILDYIFVGYFSMGATGAALATVLAQVLSTIIALIYMLRNTFIFSVQKSEFHIHISTIKNILTVGLPIALSALSASVAQNMGANKPERAKQMLYYGLIISVSFGMICTLVCQMIPQQMLALFTSDTQVIKAGSLYLMSYAWDCIFASIHFCFSGYFCGCNKPFISFIHNTISIICIRIPGAYIASQVFPDTLFPMGWAAPLGSLLSAIICIGFYIFLKRKENIKKRTARF